MDTLQSIGERIKYQRTLHDKTQRDICNIIHIEQVTLSQYETNKRTPKLEILIALADCFNVSVDYLLGRSDISEHLSAELPPYTPSAPLDPDTQKILNTFSMLNEDNRDIIIGEAKKLLKQQRLEEKRITAPVAKAT